MKRFDAGMTHMSLVHIFITHFHNLNVKVIVPIRNLVPETV
jgi:hypothetical protein